MAFLVKFFLVLLFCTLCQSELIVEPQPVLAKVGENVTFICMVDNPYPIRWCKGKNSVCDIIYNENGIKKKYELEGFSISINRSNNNNGHKLSIKNINANSFGIYYCMESFNILDPKSEARLVVLLDDPILTTVYTEKEIEMNVTFQYRGEDTLRTIWYVKYKNGVQTLYSPDNNEKNGDTVTSIHKFVLDPHIETIGYKICGIISGCYERLYNGYTDGNQHHRTRHHGHYHDTTTNVATTVKTTTNVATTVKTTTNVATTVKTTTNVATTVKTTTNVATTVKTTTTTKVKSLWKLCILLVVKLLQH